MAYTNHAKGQEKTPKWAARGKLRLIHVYGGPSHTAQMILKGSWDKSPTGLLSALRYGPKLLEDLKLKQINAVCLTWALGFSHDCNQPQWDIVRKLLSLLKKKKIKSIAQISIAAYFKDDPLHPRSPMSTQNDETGSNVCATNSLASMDAISSREQVAHDVRAAIEAGFNGLFFDCETCDPNEAVVYLKELRALAHSIQHPKAEDLIIYTNTSYLSSLDKIVNFKFVGSGIKPGFSENEGFKTNLPDWKLLFEKGGRDKAFSCGMYQGGMNEKELLLASAEILAAGGTCSDARVPPSHSRFHAKHSDLYSTGDPVDHIGILVEDTATIGNDIQPCAEFLRSLLQANIQFDLIPITHIHQFVLRKYKLLSAVHVQNMSVDLLDALTIFVRENGGVLLAALPTGISGDDKEEHATHPLLEVAPIANDGSNRYLKTVGSGTVIVYKNNESNINNTPSTILADIQRFSGASSIEVQAPDGVIALLWGKGTQRWVHMLNYRNQACSGTIILPGCGGRKLTVHSPDERKPSIEVLETGNAQAKFLITGVDNYAIVEVN